MPTQTQSAVSWALTQKDGNGNSITKTTVHSLVDAVRQYFNTNNVTYITFSYDDLKPYLV